MAERLVKEAGLGSAQDIVDHYLFWNQELVGRQYSEHPDYLPDLGRLYREQTDKLKAPFANLIRHCLIEEIDSQSDMFQTIMHESKFYKIERDKLRAHLEKSNISKKEQLLNYIKGNNVTYYLSEHQKHGVQILIISEKEACAIPATIEKISESAEKPSESMRAKDGVTQKNDPVAEDFVNTRINQKSTTRFELVDISQDVEDATRKTDSKTRFGKRSLWVDQLLEHAPITSSLDEIVEGIAEKSSTEFIKELHDQGFGSEMTYGPYFKELLLSLIPLRNAIVAFQKGDIGEGFAN